MLEIEVIVVLHFLIGAETLDSKLSNLWTVLWGTLLMKQCTSHTAPFATVTNSCAICS